MAESLSFDLFARDVNASRNIKQVGNAALETSGKLDVAAASMKLYDQTSQKQGKAASATVAAMKSHAKATGLLADAEAVLAGKATVTTKLIADQGREFDRAAKHTDVLAGSAVDLGGTLGKLGNLAIPAVVTSAVALAPALVTVGLGLTGFGAAAVGLLKPLADAATKTGGLRANLAGLDPEQRQAARSLLSLGDAFKGFEKALAPEVFGVFNRGLHLARGLMGDLLPVSKAAGAGLGGLFDRVDAEFHSNTWQDFFGFMGKTAGTDIRLLSDSLLNILHLLPQLLEALQPVTVAMLGLSDAFTTASVASVGLDGNIADVAATGLRFAKVGALMSAAAALLSGDVKGAGEAMALFHDVSGPLGKSLAGTGDNAKTAAGHVQTLTDKVNALNTAETNALDPQLAYANALITGANDAKALRDALQQSHDKIGLHTQAQRNSFSTANQFISNLEDIAKQAVNSGHGQDAARTAISRALPILESAKSHSKLYWQEVQILRDWLLRLNRVPNVHESIFMTGHGRWGIFGQGQGQGSIFGSGKGGSLAAGGMIRGGVTGRDSVPVLTMPGEVVVPTRMVNAGAVDHLRGSLPGFAGGGVIGSYAGGPGGLKPWGQHNWNASMALITSSLAHGIVSAMRSAIRSAQAAAAFAGGPGGGAPAANAALARRLFPQWGSGANWAAWNYVAMRESGWNQYARNPSSGAYGIPQALPASKMGAAANPPQSNPTAQIRWMAGYMSGRYGGPQGAANHERAFSWYDKGGWLPRGLSLAYNGTGYPEQVVPHGSGRGGTVTVRFDFSRAHNHQLADIIRDAVRVQGGGDVQVALGTSH